MTEQRPSGRSRTAPPRVSSPVSTVETVNCLLRVLRAETTLGARDEVVAAQMVSLALQLDNGAGMASASISRQLMALLDALPRVKEDNPIERLIAQRQARRATACS
jgi:hypothetical protein